MKKTLSLVFMHEATAEEIQQAQEELHEKCKGR